MSELALDTPDSAVDFPRIHTGAPAPDRSPSVSQRVLAEFVGVSTAAEQVRRQIGEAALGDGPQLITGESGTGTAHVARLVHAAGPRAFRPFIKLDCRVLAGEILQRELFGDDIATESATGWLSDPRGGTLFLDHIDEMPLPLQSRLATWLASSTEQNSRPAGLEPRILVASHVNLPEQARAGAFCPELLRLLRNGLIEVPSIRKRLLDLCLLIEHFVTEIATREGRAPRRIAADAIPLLERHRWPGNVRELRNVIERACAVDSGVRLTAAALAPWIAAEDSTVEVASGFSLREMERRLIETTFARYGGNRERTAQALQIGLRTLSGKLREYGYPPRGGPGSNCTAQTLRAA